MHRYNNKAVILSRGFIFAASVMAGGMVSANARASSQYVTPPDSFLQYPVYSVSQLVQEIQANPLVRQRYAEHFQIPANQIVPWMRKNLVESYVPNTKTYTVYCVTPSGKSFYEKQTFRKGTKVFALRSGVPLMKWICGNPLMGFTQQALANKPVITKEAPSLQEQTPAMQVTPLMESAGGGIPGSIVGAGPSPLYALAALGGALPVLGFFGQSSGGGGGTPLKPNTPPVAVVPEPVAPMLLLAALPLIGLAARRRRPQS